MFRSVCLVAMIAALGACAGGARRPSPQPVAVTGKAAFDPRAAWDEFERTVRDDYAYLTRDDFPVDAQLAHSRELALQTSDAETFRAILHRTTFAFTDPHFLVGPLAPSDPNVIPTSSDLVIELRGRDYYVADVRAGSPADEAGIRPGWRFVSAGAKPIDEAIEAIWAGVVTARTEKQRAYAATLVGNGRREGTRSLGFEAAGKPLSLSLENPAAFAKRVEARAPLSLETRDRVRVIRFENSLGKAETIAAFDAASRTLSDADAVVLDLRNTPSGGNTDVARAIMGHFVSEARPYQVHEIPAVQRSTTVPRRFVEQVLPRAPRYGGRVAVLGGHWTGSMGEGVVIGMNGAAGAHTFASNMGDLLGALHHFDLKRSPARVEFGAEALFHVNGTPRERYIPDVTLPTADRDAQGNDPGMFAVSSWLELSR